ncbi:MAG: NAD-dependent epimerase/dehydratase family protein, partial [Candidatus Thermoplasmatota archaeon]|nr:NAD-dependent epimerase/dehydratase family protein [Candidatus Thermoplasmatota archaeon]
DESDLIIDPTGDFPEFSAGDEVRVGGSITNIHYFGSIEDYKANNTFYALYPIPGEGLEKSMAPGDKFSIIDEANINTLFATSGDGSQNGVSSINYANGETIDSDSLPIKKEYKNTNLGSALFTNLKFKDVIFSNVIFDDTFFIGCSFERVAFYNVEINRAIFSNNTFDTVVFNNVTFSDSRIENAEFETFWVKESRFNNTDFDRTNIIGSKWSYSSLENGTFLRSNLDVVIFRSLYIENFVLILSDIKNNIDAPLTSNFDFTRIKIGESEIRVTGDIESQYAIGAQVYFGGTNVENGGEGAGTAGKEGGWLEGSIQGEGFRTSAQGNISYNLEHEFLSVDAQNIKLTFWWNFLFDAIAFLGFGVLIYAVGGQDTVLGLLRFFSPFIMTGAFFAFMFLTMSQRDFLILSQLMLVYFVPPFGKGTVIPGGIAVGIDPWILAIATAFVDIAVGVFLTWNFDLAKKIPFIGSGITRVQRKGQDMLKSLPWLERASFVGIVVFVMFPFQGSGAVGGTILGRAIGLSPNKNLAAVTIGAVSGSFLLSASIVYGLGVIAILAPIQVAVAVLFLGFLVAIVFMYQHWDDISIDEVTQTLGLHKEGIIGAPLTAAGGLVGSAGGTVLKVAGDTGKTVVTAADNTGKMITKTTGDLVGGFLGSLTEDKYDFADPNKPLELESGVLVSMPEDGSKNTVVVTGGAGFIGSHLVDRLVKRDEHVVVLDNFSSGELEFLYESVEQITVIDIDLLKDDFEKYLKGAKIVYHLAANPEVQLGITKPEVMQEQNVDVTERVLKAMKNVGCDRIVFTSTSTVYGDAKKIPTPETAELKPISAYGSSKLDAEKLIERYCKEHDFIGVSYRFANCVGPRSNHGVTYDFVNKLKDNPKELEILGDGKQHKSYFHVKDCISGMLTKTPTELCEKGEFVALNV